MGQSAQYVSKYWVVHSFILLNFQRLGKMAKYILGVGLFRILEAAYQTNTRNTDRPGRRRLDNGGGSGWWQCVFLI
jgi:hypothetical protein